MTAVWIVAVVVVSAGGAVVFGRAARRNHEAIGVTQDMQDADQDAQDRGDDR